MRNLGGICNCSQEFIFQSEETRKRENVLLLQRGIHRSRIRSLVKVKESD